MRLTAIARIWFKKMRACGENVLELMHDGCAARATAPPYPDAFVTPHWWRAPRTVVPGRIFPTPPVATTNV